MKKMEWKDVFGPNFTDVEIASELNECGAKFEKVSRNNLIQQIVSEISNNKIIMIREKWNLGHVLLAIEVYWQILDRV